MTLKLRKKGFRGSSKIQQGVSKQCITNKIDQKKILSPFHFVHVKCNPGFVRAWFTLVLAYYNLKSDDNQQKITKNDLSEQP